MAATLKARVAGVWQHITGVAPTFVNARVGGAWVELQFIRAAVRIGNNIEWKDVYLKSGAVPPAAPPPTPDPPPATPTTTLRVNISPSTVSGSRAGAGLAVTAAVTAAASRGTAPYTYKWVLVSHTTSYTSNTPFASAPNNNVTQFNRTMGNGNQTETARFRCRVTDAVGNKGSAIIDVKFISVPSGSVPPSTSPNPWYDQNPDENLP